jgi:hypothetical protein
MAFKDQEQYSWKPMPLDKDLKEYRATGKINLPDGAEMIIYQDPIYTKPNREKLANPMSDDYDKLKKAVLCLKSDKGKILDLKELDRPTAKFEKNKICPGSRSYLLEVDYDAGFGSYNGPITFMIEVKEQKISFVQMDHNGQMLELALMDSLKTVWWPASRVENGCHDILHFACRPDFEKRKQDMPFKLIYRRYHFNGRKWMVYEREEKGFWESDETRPKESLFPKATPSK